MKKGFTLIELIIVLMIIGVLSAVVLLNITESRKRSMTVKTRATIKQYMTAAQMYFAEQSEYPDGATQGTWPGVFEKYVSANGFKDAWGNGLKWDNDGLDGNKHYKVGIKSHGPDETAGGNTCTGNDDIRWGLNGYLVCNWEE